MSLRTLKNVRSQAWFVCLACFKDSALNLPRLSLNLRILVLTLTSRSWSYPRHLLSGNQESPTKLITLNFRLQPQSFTASHCQELCLYWCNSTWSGRKESYNRGKLAGVNWDVMQITIKLHKKITHITELIHYATNWIGISYKTEHSAEEKKNFFFIHFR